MTIPNSSSLDSIQRWMQTVITHPEGIEAGICSQEARQQIDTSIDQVEQVISRSRALSSVERLNIYGQSYYARLMDCLRDVFTALVHTLGEETFDSFSFSYLQEYPPSSYSLAFLADHFVEFLERSKPESDEGDSSWADFLIDLARLEWNIDQVFDGPGMEHQQPLQPEDFSEFVT